MDDILERWRIPIVIALVIIISAGVIALYIRWPRQATGNPVVADPQRSPARSILLTTPTARLPVLKVYVSGAVVRPGVYPFHDGDRVEDALMFAGGATVEADLSRVNLAQRLRDEGQIVIPRLNDNPAPGIPATASSPAQSGKININSASIAELDALPGIGAAYAQRIIDHRTKNGAFQRITDLVDAKLVPQSTFDKIKDMIDIW